MISSYPDKELNAYPYAILVSDPRPSFREGKTAFYDFPIDTVIPKIKIPLAGADTVAVDFNSAYQNTFASNRYYGTILVDYEQLPVNFEAYTEVDQQRIHERMQTAQAKHTQ